MGSEHGFQHGCESGCQHKRWRWIDGNTCDLTGEQLEGEWSEEMTALDLDVGRYRCTQCGLVMYYTGQWRDYHELGIPCAGSDGVQRVPPNTQTPIEVDPTETTVMKDDAASTGDHVASARPDGQMALVRALREGEVMGAYIDFDRRADRSWTPAEYLVKFGQYVSRRTAEANNRERSARRLMDTAGDGSPNKDSASAELPHPTESPAVSP
jgi:hypothetical protein